MAALMSHRGSQGNRYVTYERLDVQGGQSGPVLFELVWGLRFVGERPGETAQRAQAIEAVSGCRLAV